MEQCNRFLHLLYLLCVLFYSCGTEFKPNFCPSLSECSSSTESGGSSVIYSTLFLDNFTRADETPLGAPWNFVLVGGDNIELKTNFVSLTETDGVSPPGALHTTLINATNARVSMDVNVTAAGYAGNMLIYFRSQSNGDLNNAYFCGVNPGSGQLTIGKTVATVNTQLGISVATMTYDNGDSYTLTFTGEGSSLTCELSGSDSLSVTATDSDFSTGYGGFAGGQSGNNAIDIDDFHAETGP